MAGAEGGGPGLPGPEGRGSYSRGEGQAKRTPPPGSDATEQAAGLNGARAAWRKRKGVRRSCCRHRRHPRPGWRKWRRRRRPRRTRSILTAQAAAQWTWSGAGSPTAWCGRPSRCSRGFSPSSATWASAHPQESFGTSLAPTLCRYWKLDPAQVYASGPNAWDTAVHDASEEYKHRMHSLCCDNCHSHVALALNLMRYNNSTNWNMVTLCFFCLLYGKYVSVGAFVKTWLPFVLLLGVILTVSLVFNLR
ncbi:transmembrane protein 222 isoform X1 [Vicugna pacos]|uniref:Transmembrane protein 222 isoform X1 n=1 Tax=Vicugna pacos TaxID=30538 RepID=A0ABM5ED85_VICPA